MLNQEISFVVPCFNPPGGWQETLCNRFAEVARAFPKMQFTLILVDDGSVPPLDTDPLNFRISHPHKLVNLRLQTNQGKGYALRTGIATVTSNIFVTTDVDFPYDTESMVRIIKLLITGEDAVFGFRMPDYYRNVPPARRLLSKIFRYVLKLIARLPVTDTQCGLKGFSINAKPYLLQTTIDRYLFDMEVAKILGRTKDINIVTAKVRLRSGTVFSSMNPGILLRETSNFMRILFS